MEFLKVMKVINDGKDLTCVMIRSDIIIEYVMEVYESDWADSCTLCMESINGSTYITDDDGCLGNGCDEYDLIDDVCEKIGLSRYDLPVKSYSNYLYK